ncbi:hypothetical protein RRG08_064228 [Elysia crispata]|uniref:Uncharacterized protein n=1 Tax=Elysia crispata TaxID=231223 RepID=A0AAE0YE99_9GAST|nr:hypothetical protein RRG08_064228 [Elysia crispata]
MKHRVIRHSATTSCARHQDTVACPPNPAQASTTSSPSARGSAPAPWDNVLHIHTATQTCLTCAQPTLLGVAAGRSARLSFAQHSVS